MYVLVYSNMSHSVVNISYKLQIRLIFSVCSSKYDEIIIIIPSCFFTQTFLSYSNSGAKMVFGESYEDHFFAFKV